MTRGAALAAVALLAGCDPAPEDGSNVGPGAGSVPVGSLVPSGGSSFAHDAPDDDAGAAGDLGLPPPSPNDSLQPYPLDSVTSDPPDAGRYDAPGCRFQAHCYAPSDGEACASELSLALEAELTPPHISISFCGCSTKERPTVEGPFARNPAHPSDAAGDPAATCCYVIGTGVCLGRPFVVAGLAHIAPASIRADWGLFA